MQTNPHPDHSRGRTHATEGQRTAALVDRLGRVKADLATLAADEQYLVDELKKRGVAVYQGELFEANVFESSSSKLDKEKLCKKHKLMQKWLDQCTTSKSGLTCKVTAKVQR